MPTDSYLFRLNHLFHDSPNRIWEIIKYYPSESDFEANHNAIIEHSRGTDASKATIRQRFDAFDFDREIAELKRLEIEWITPNSPQYPDLLRQTGSPPATLFLKGNPQLLEKDAIAIVGSRFHSQYGIRCTAQLTQELGNYFCIVSGLAAGIDTIAHQSALQYRHDTIAVIGTGLDITYPKTNADLADRIAKHGLVVSEYPLGTAPLPYRFPQRNRIIAGLSKGTLVTEARQKSGALITAQIALEENRDVFAVPGPIDSEKSAGPNSLIKAGAKLVQSAQDIVDEYNVLFSSTSSSSAPKSKPVPKNLSPVEQQLYDLLATEKHIDELANTTQLDTQTILQTLTNLELKNVITQTSSMAYTHS